MIRFCQALIALCLIGLFDSPANKVAVIDSYFSPGGNCTEQIVNQIKTAKKSILVAAYQLTSPSVKQALIDAKERGVEVKIIVDKEQRNDVQDLVKAGITIWIDSKHAIFHFKFIVIDDAILLTGSFNYSVNAEKHNAENLLLIRYQKTIEDHKAVWMLHKTHSELLE